MRRASNRAQVLFLFFFPSSYESQPFFITAGREASHKERYSMLHFILCGFTVCRIQSAVSSLCARARAPAC